jgi:Zn-dependent protease/predicted transcriptional regulator
MLRGGIPIGKAFGINLRLHYSWFIIFVLITWALTTSYFPTAYPTWSMGTKITAGLITSLLFFGSVLAHELMHSIIAQHQGLPVKSITLFIFGGVSQIAGEPKRAGDEFRIAIAGPLTSLFVGGMFWGIWFWLRGQGGASEFLGAIAYWLGLINVFLAGFNLIPGFPLDGGRVLRSILWGRSQNLRTATKTASNIGRAIGYIFIFIGIFLIFQGNWFNGLWLAFIGWFLENAAVGSYRQLALQDMLHGHVASEIMTRDCLTVPTNLSIERLINEHMLTSGRRCFPVVEDDHVMGLVTLHNVRAIPRDQWNIKTVGEAMTPFDNIKLIRPDTDLSMVLRIMSEDDINQIPVVLDHNVVGMISRDNILSFIDIRSGLGM